MKLQHIGFFEPTANPTFEVVVRISVDHVGALWNAAMTAAVEIHGMDIEDAIDTIGPREDPAIADCIALLAAPSPVSGCTLESFDVIPASVPVSTAMFDIPALRAVTR